MKDHYRLVSEQLIRGLAFVSLNPDKIWAGSELIFSLLHLDWQEHSLQAIVLVNRLLKRRIYQKRLTPSALCRVPTTQFKYLP